MQAGPVDGRSTISHEAAVIVKPAGGPLLPFAGHAQQSEDVRLRQMSRVPALCAAAIRRNPTQTGCSELYRHGRIGNVSTRSATKTDVTRVSPFLVAAALLTVSTVSSALDSRFLQGLGDSHYVRMESETIGRDYHLFVMLPDSYEQNDEKSYPTVYVLDGGTLFPLLVAYYRYLNFGKEIPDLIIVGISYGSSSYEGGNYRSTDYTAESDEREYWGGAGAFQSFLKDEMIPYVERSYRARPDRRIIFGQSIGGQFVLYTALTEPNLFWGHIASNPALHRNLPFFLQDAGAASSSGELSRLFVGSGSLDNPEFRIPALKWIAHWSAKSDAPWQLETMTLGGHTHMSAPPASFRQGMRWLFSEQQEQK